MIVTIDEQLKAKCSCIALGCVRAHVAGDAAPEALLRELQASAQKIAGLPDPRAFLESPAILATRRGYKALGKDPSRYRGSAEALLRRVICGRSCRGSMRWSM